MTKTEVIKFFGSVEAVARAVRSSGSAVSQWPESLSNNLQDRVIGACTRLKISFPNEWILDLK